MGRRALASGVAGFGAIAIASFAACRDTTQITVVLTTNVRCGDDRGVTITVGELDGLTRPWGLAVDATTVWFTTVNGGSVLRVAK